MNKIILYMNIDTKEWAKLTNKKILLDYNKKLLVIKKQINKSSTEYSFLRKDNNLEIFKILRRAKKIQVIR